MMEQVKSNQLNIDKIMKTKYNIIGISKYGREIIDTAKDKKEAEYLIKEYRMAYGKEWSIYSKKTK